MKILSLDIGTKTGWAFGSNGNLLDCGTITLATDKEIADFGKTRMSRRLDSRIPRLWNHLTIFFNWGHGIDWIVFEDVLFNSSRMQAHLWASYRAVIWLFAAQNKIQVECLDVKKLKLFGAGHGGATKEMMAKALGTGEDDKFVLDAESSLVEFHPIKIRRLSDNQIMTRNKVLDDNAVDAVHLLKWAMKTLKA